MHTHARATIIPTITVTTTTVNIIATLKAYTYSSTPVHHQSPAHPTHPIYSALARTCRDACRVVARGRDPRRLEIVAVVPLGGGAHHQQCHHEDARGGAH